MLLKLWSDFQENSYSQTLAHYYCELAEIAITAGNNDIAEKYLESAFSHDARCIRAVIQSGRLASMRGNHTNAIAIWRGLEYWAPEALGEVAGHISNSYAKLNDRRSFKKFLESALEKNPDPRIIAMLVDLTRNNSGNEAGQTLLLNLVRKHPSLESLYQLMKSRSQDKILNRQDQDFSLSRQIYWLMWWNPGVTTAAGNVDFRVIRYTGNAPDVRVGEPFKGNQGINFHSRHSS